jgi:hypothetical protein
MGRYDGEEYESQAPCSPSEHKWCMNGTCFTCRHDRDSLIAEAKKILKLQKEGKFGRYAG